MAGTPLGRRLLSSICDGDYCLDDVLLEELDDKLQQLSATTTFIVLHQMGSHGPTYYRRYPDAYKKFLPDCPRSDIQNCTDQELSHTYDNTILYTDHVLNEVIERLQALPRGYQTAMVYVSDHGESLGENGVFLHGLPYAFSPTEQTHIPMITWFSDAFNQDRGLKKECLMNLADSATFSHDHLFHMILSLLHVETSVFEKHNDIVSRCLSVS